MASIEINKNKKNGIQTQTINRQGISKGTKSKNKIIKKINKKDRGKIKDIKKKT